VTARLYSSFFSASLVYFVPWFVAMIRDHHQRSAIAVLNLFLGWTALGWIIALVWACTAVQTKEPHDA
jgi:hypothetical protein